MLILNQSEDITFLILVSLEIINDTTILGIAFHLAIIMVQGTVTGGLVGVEVAFHQATYSTMLQYAKVTGIFDATGRCVT